MHIKDAKKMTFTSFLNNDTVAIESFSHVKEFKVDPLSIATIIIMDKDKNYVASANLVPLKLQVKCDDADLDGLVLTDGVDIVPRFIVEFSDYDFITKANAMSVLITVFTLFSKELLKEEKKYYEQDVRLGLRKKRKAISFNIEDYPPSTPLFLCLLNSGFNEYLEKAAYDLYMLKVKEGIYCTNFGWLKHYIYQPCYGAPLGCSWF